MRVERVESEDQITAPATFRHVRDGRKRDVDGFLAAAACDLEPVRARDRGALPSAVDKVDVTYRGSLSSRYGLRRGLRRRRCAGLAGEDKKVSEKERSDGGSRLGFQERAVSYLRNGKTIFGLMELTGRSLSDG